MAQIYLTGAVSDWDDPFQWHDELQESEEFDHDFVNPYTLNDFELGDDGIYDTPERVVEPALDAVEDSDGMLVRWDDEIYDRPDEIVEPALDAVESSDGLLVRWDDDAFLVGTSMEMKHAFDNDVPIIIWYDGYRDNLSPWLLHMSKGNFETKEKALRVLLGFVDTGFTFSK